MALAAKGAVPLAGVVDERFSFVPLTRQEREACDSCVSTSAASCIQLMPNHMLTETGEISGFCFRSTGAEKVSTIPMDKNIFGTTAVYECVSGRHSKGYISIVNSLEATQSRLQALVKELEGCEHHLNFECMHDWTNSTNVSDQRVWNDALPSKMGVYHCFMRTNAQNEREHKIFLVVSGNCRHASEELHKLWLDAREDITIAQFMECGEVVWLRQATLRWLNRVAWRMMHALELSSNAVVTDYEAVGARVSMLIPTHFTVYNDMAINPVTNEFVMTNNAALLQKAGSGVIFDCFSSEGFWIFHGPRDTSSYKIFGSDFSATKDCYAFPTQTVRYHALHTCKKAQSQVSLPRSSKVDVKKSTTCLYGESKALYTGFMFPDSSFIQQLEKLGFSYNNGITNLMPIVMYCGDE
ncbi:MAG: hypothetical protein EBR09_07500 [Proteobacteria bacterium]|jgi:hypothetical protein|nr:hypothetical protein [Pseudomonadota bacterium]